MAKGMTSTMETKTDPLIHRKIGKTPVNMHSINAMTPESDHKVIGTFVNVEAPGCTQKVSLKLYKGMQYFNEVLHDNEKCTIPFSVARYINEEFAKDEHSYLTDERGSPMKTGRKVPRGKFLIEEHLPV